nr:ATP-binding cassette domain-containing protein [Streptomyces arenae]
MTSVVSVDSLRVAYRSGGREVPVVHEVSLEVAPARTLALVGESGSGKSTVAATLLGHLRHGSRITGGRVHVDGRTCSRCPHGSCAGCAAGPSPWWARTPDRR